MRILVLLRCNGLEFRENSLPTEPGKQFWQRVPEMVERG